jgi:hypothetical protein
MQNRTNVFDKYSDRFNFVVNFIDLPKNDLSAFAHGYKIAADALSSNILENQIGFADFELYPIVFLYRHSFELYLKALMYHCAHAQRLEGLPAINEQYKSHELVQIAVKVQGALKIISESDKEILKTAARAVQVAKDFAAKDKDSFSYRYPINTNGDRSTDRHQFMNLRALYEEMTELLDDLDSIAEWLTQQNVDREDLKAFLQYEIGSSGTF